MWTCRNFRFRIEEFKNTIFLVRQVLPHRNAGKPKGFRQEAASTFKCWTCRNCRIRHDEFETISVGRALGRPNAGKGKVQGKKLGIIISGGNVDLQKLPF